MIKQNGKERDEMRGEEREKEERNQIPLTHKKSASEDARPSAITFHSSFRRPFTSSREEEEEKGKRKGGKGGGEEVEGKRRDIPFFSLGKEAASSSKVLDRGT